MQIRRITNGFIFTDDTARETFFEKLEPLLQRVAEEATCRWGGFRIFNNGNGSYRTSSIKVSVLEENRDSTPEEVNEFFS